MKIAITGSTGLVGTRIVELLKNSFEFVPLLQESIDITDRRSVKDFVDGTDFDLLLHLAAYTNVDGAEMQRKIAYDINVGGTKNLFDAVQNKGKKFIYISTGFVFDGVNPPFYEDSKPNPIGYYGKTKYEGEKIVATGGMIVRLEYPYRAFFPEKIDFVRAIKGRLESGQPVLGITDSLITPTFIDDIAFALQHLMNNFSSETFHLVGGDTLSPYDAALAVAETWHLDKKLVRKTTYGEFFAGRAKRPQQAYVKSKKNNFYAMKTFAEGLQAMK